MLPEIFTPNKQLHPVDSAKAASLKLFSNVPMPLSSSEPFDIIPPATVPAIVLTDAR